MRFILAAFLLTSFFYQELSNACSIFAARGTNYSILAKSYDWHTSVGLVMANMPGVHKASLNFSSPSCPEAPTTPVIWTAKYGSITFNQFGRDLPNGGMNEAGLAIEMAEMEPSNAKGTPPSEICYVPEGATKSLNTQQFMQYVLDSFQSVSELKEDLQKKEYALVPYMISIHYMVCDPDNCAIIEIGRDGELRQYYLDDPASMECPLPDPDLDPAEQESLGCNPTIELDDQTTTSPMVLTNDYYYCSVNALTQYQGYGGVTAIPQSPFCADADYCDICRKSTGIWSDSNSVERFVAATDYLLYTQPFPDQYLASFPTLVYFPAFTVLNKVFNVEESGGEVTGGTVWQIVYDLDNKIIHWKTSAGGYDADGLTGFIYRIGLEGGNFGKDDYIDIIDFKDFGCESEDYTLVLNIDSAGICQINSDLACSQDDTPVMQPYQEDFNIDLVRTAAKQSLPLTLDNFKGYVQKNLSGINDSDAEEILYGIWGGYPRGYTACDRDPTSADVASLILSASLHPYINPTIGKNIPDPFTVGKTSSSCDSTDCVLACIGLTGIPTADKLNYTVNAFNVSGTSSIFMTNLSVKDNTLYFNGGVSNLSSNEVDIDLSCHWLAPAGASGTTTAGTLSFYFNAGTSTFSGHTTGIEIGDDFSNPFCFDQIDPQVDTTLSKLTVHDCKHSVYPSIDLTNICQQVVDAKKSDINNKVESGIESGMKQYLPSYFPACGVTLVAPPDPLELTVDWADIADNTTVYAGRTYFLQAIVVADQDSLSSEHIVFTEGVPGGENSKVIGSDRIRSFEGMNYVSTLWTPEETGDAELYVDVMPMNEQKDEVEPALLTLKVLPADQDPSPGEDIIPLALVAAGSSSGSSSGCSISIYGGSMGVFSALILMIPAIVIVIRRLFFNKS